MIHPADRRLVAGLQSMARALNAPKVSQALNVAAKRIDQLATRNRELELALRRAGVTANPDTKQAARPDLKSIAGVIAPNGQ